MAIKPLTVITKLSGALALASVACDSNKIGVNQALENSRVSEAKRAVKNNIGVGKLNYESPKYSKIKEKVYEYYPYSIGNIWHGFKGYLSGFSRGAINELGTVLFGALALVAKHKPVKIASLIGLGASKTWNFIKHGTNALEKTDYLE